MFLSSPSFTQQNKALFGLNDIIQSYSCAFAGQERLFVFLNSGFYYPGENLSFKAVLFDADMKIKTEGSRFFYLQLINSTGKSIGNYTYELHSGECSAQISLPDTLITGLYTLKAYTRWMQNYGSDNAFRRPLLIVSPLNVTTLNSNVWDTIPLHFYPEGGNFVAGVANTIWVRVNPFRNITVRHLNVVDDRGKILLSCSIDTNGTGVVSFTPEPGRTYHAIVADSSQPMQTFKLPELQYSGYSLNIRNDKDFLNISIASARETENEQALYLAVLTGNAKMSFVKQVNMIDHRGTILVPVTDLPSGLSQVILFHNNTIMCSRLWYRKSDRGMGIEILATDTLKTRESASAAYYPGAVAPDKILTISINEYNPITDSILYNEINHYRYFDLYSSLSRPEILPLFEASASEKYINDCLIALTRSLSMDFVFPSPDSKRYTRETEGVLLTGKVFFPETRLPVSGATILLSYPDSVAYMNYSITNDQGEFSFTLNSRLYNRQVYIIAQGYPHSSNPVSIVMDDPFRMTSSGIDESPLLHPCFETVVGSHQNIAMAYRVFYHDKTQPSQKVIRQHSTYTENFYGKPDFSLIPAEYESLPDIFEIRKNLIPELRLKVENNYCLMTVFDEYLQLFHSQQAFVLLNNIPYPSFRNVLELNSDAIRSIELKRNKFFYDDYLIYGIVAIRTTKPIEIEPFYSYHITTTAVIPDTDKTSSVEILHEGTLPDVRHSLYWRTSPTNISESSGIRFRTSDIKGRYHLKVFYRAPDGSLQCTEKEYSVL